MKQHPFSILEQALGAKSKVAVLRTLYQSRLGYSGSALAKETGIGLLAIQNTLTALESLGLVEVERGKVEHRYRLNTHHYLVNNGLRALLEGERGMQQALVRDLRPLLEGKVIAAGLFGSFARGDAKPGSDIDLFIAVQTLQDRERVNKILTDAQFQLTQKYGLPIQPVVFERQRLTSGNGRNLLENAAQDWQPITGTSPVELLESLAAAKPARRRS